MSATKREKTEQKLRATIENLKQELATQSAAHKNDRQQIKDLKAQNKELKSKLPPEEIDPPAPEETPTEETA